MLFGNSMLRRLKITPLAHVSPVQPRLAHAGILCPASVIGRSFAHLARKEQRNPFLGPKGTFQNFHISNGLQGKKVESTTSTMPHAILSGNHDSQIVSDKATKSILEGPEVGLTFEEQRKLEQLKASTDRDMLTEIKRTSIDKSGHVKTEGVDEDIKALCEKYKVRKRDLRRIDSIDSMTTILVRPGIVLCRTLQLRALITKDVAMLLEVKRENDKPFLTKDAVQKLQSYVQLPSYAGEQLPFELCVLEFILARSVMEIETTTRGIRKQVSDVLQRLDTQMDQGMVLRLSHLSRELAALHTRAQQLQVCVNDILADDASLRGLYLSSNESTSEERRSAADSVMEEASFTAEDLLHHVRTLESHVQDAEYLIELTLATGRNALMTLSTKVDIAMLALSSSALIAAIFGMNLTSGLEEHPRAFYYAVGFCMALAYVGARVGFRIVNRTGSFVR